MVGDFIGVPHDGLAPFDPLAYRHTDLGTQRKERVHPRTKPDQSESFPTLHAITLPNPADDPAGDQPGDLYAENLRAGFGLQHHGILFIPERRLRLTHHQKLPGLITHPFYGSGAGHPVHMHVKHVQKHRHPDAFFLQIPWLELFLNRNDLAVSRRDHHVGLLRDGAAGVPKEPPGKQQEPTGHHRRNRPSRHPTDQGHSGKPTDKGQAFSDNRNPDGAISHTPPGPLLCYHEKPGYRVSFCSYRRVDLSSATAS